jgi:glycosyltransferase involved in cell wall biosynthesis
MNPGSPSILYISPASLHGGAEEMLLGYMQAALALKLRPVVVMPSEGWLSKTCREQRVGVEILPSLPDVFGSGFLRQFSPWVLNGWRIRQLVRKHRAVLIHSNKLQAAYHGGLGAWLAGVPGVAHLHDIYHLEQATRIKLGLLRQFNRQVICVSVAVQNKVETFFPGLKSRLLTIHNGLDLSQYQTIQPWDLRKEFGLAPETLLVGCIGALRPLKGQDVLISALALIKDQLPNAILFIVGSTQGVQNYQEYAADLHQLVSKLGLSQRVIFTGWREDALAVLAGLDILAHVPVEFDAFPTVLLHAAGLGKPVVATRVGGIPEILGQGGMLVAPGDAEALAQMLLRLGNSPQECAKLGAHSHGTFIQFFNQDKMVAALAEVYSALLEKKK